VTKLAVTCFVDVPAEVVQLVKTHKTYRRPGYKLEVDDVIKYPAFFTDSKKAAGR
jgi:hypothetical protein